MSNADNVALDKTVILHYLMSCIVSEGGVYRKYKGVEMELQVYLHNYYILGIFMGILEISPK